VNQPAGEIANIDDLDGVTRVAGDRDLSAAIEAHRPVGETTRRIVGTDDEARTHDRRASRHRPLRRRLAERLEAPVVLVALAHLLHARIRERRQRCILGAADGIRLPIAADARDVDVLLDATGEQLRGGRNRARVVSRIVEDRVPLAGPQGIEAGSLLRIAIAEALLHVRKQPRPRLSAVEQGDLMTLGERYLDDRGAEEAGAAEDQDALGFRRIVRDGCGHHGRLLPACHQ